MTEIDYEKFFQVKEADIVVEVGDFDDSFAERVLNKNPKHIFRIESSNFTIPLLNTNNITNIDFLKFNSKGDNSHIFTKKNYDFIINKVRYIVGNWDATSHETAIEEFIAFRDLYLKDHKNVRVFELCEFKEVTFEIFNNEYLYRFRDWFKTTELGHWVIYIDNTEQKSEFTFNNKSRNRVWVVDDFYSNPSAVREFALHQEYVEGGIGRGFIGRRTVLQFLFPGLKERFEEIMGRKIVTWEDHGMNGRFQVAWSGEPLVYHCDAQKWAGMLYLTPEAPFETGTTLYAHKKTRAQDYYHPRWNEIWPNVEKTHLDKTPFEPVDVMGNVFNRLVIFDASSIHSASEYFGQDKQDGRLWQMFFFD